MGNKRKYSCNDQYFSSMSLEACYWAGFIAADGYINPRSRGVEITLATLDKDHLRKFLECAGSDSLITTYSRRPNECTVRINAVPLWLEVLESRFNITTKKSHTLQPPKLSGNQLWSFVIGFLDGDGCITHNKDNYISLKFTGNFDMMQWLCQLFDEHFPPSNGRYAKVISYKSGTTAKRYELTGKRALEILTFLNKINVPKMQRKWSKVV